MTEANGNGRLKITPMAAAASLIAASAIFGIPLTSWFAIEKFVESRIAQHAQHPHANAVSKEVLAAQLQPIQQDIVLIKGTLVGRTEMNLLTQQLGTLGETVAGLGQNVHDLNSQVAGLKAVIEAQQK